MTIGFVTFKALFLVACGRMALNRILHPRLPKNGSMAM